MDDQLVHRALADPSRRRILAVLADHAGTLPVLEVAGAVGLHPTTVRAHLGVLADAGLVESEAEPRSTPGRRRLRYRPTRDGALAVDAGHRAEGYELLARVLATHVAATAPDAGVAGVEAGLRWADETAKPPRPAGSAVSVEEAEAAVLTQLDELGFAPERTEDGATIRLRRCPFLDVATTDADVVCSVHLGLVRGLLSSIGAPVEATGLTPFAEPTACHLRIERSLG